MIGEGNWQVLVFTRTKHGANHLAEQLNKDGIRSAAIHGNKSQGARTRALADFKPAAFSVLVATDIAARGLDIEELPHVVNYEPPNVPEDYVPYRSYRARRGTGEALSLVCVDEHKLPRYRTLAEKRSRVLPWRATSRIHRLKPSRFRTVVSSSAAAVAVARVRAAVVRGKVAVSSPTRVVPMAKRRKRELRTVSLLAVVARANPSRRSTAIPSLLWRVPRSRG